MNSDKKYFNTRTKKWQNEPDEDTIEMLPAEEDFLLFGSTEEEKKEGEER